MMQRIVIVGAVCLTAGLLIGFFGANSLNRDYAPAPSGTISDAVLPVQTVQQNSSAPLPDIAEMLEKADKEKDNFAVQMQTGDMYA